MERRNDADSEEGMRALGVLDTARLDFFRSEPATIAPFGSSVLKWKVEGPVDVRIDAEWGLPATGSKEIQPQSTHDYRLYAQLDADSKFLGSARVTVNTAQCVPLENGLVAQLLHAGLTASINERQDIYFRLIGVKDAQGKETFFRSEPVITVTPGQIKIVLKLAAKADNFPDPDVDVEISFGLGIAVFDDISSPFNPRRKVVPAKASVDVNVSVPWWAWLIPGAPIGLPIAISMAEDSARGELSADIPRLVDEAIVGPLVVPPKMDPLSVRILVGGLNNKGAVGVTFCPREIPVFDP